MWSAPKIKIPSVIQRLLDNKQNPFFRDVVFTTTVQILVLVMNVAILKITSSKMTIEDFGLFNVAKRSASLLGYVLLLGLGISIPRFLARYNSAGNRNEENQVFMAGLIILGIFTFIGIVFSSLFKETMSVLLFGTSQNTDFVMPLMFNVMGIVCSTFVTAYYRGMNHMKYFNFIQLFLQAVLLFLLLFFAAIPIELIKWWGLSWTLFSIILLVSVIAQRLEYIRQISWRQLHKKVIDLFSFGGPRVLGEFALFGYFAIPLIILSSRGDLKSVALITIPVSFFQLISAVFGYAGYVLLPHVSAGIANNSFDLIKKDIRNLEVLYLLLGILTLLVMMGLTPLLTRLFFSSEYLVTVPYTRIMIFGIIPYVFYLLYRNPLDAASHVPYNSVNLIISLIIVTIIFIFSKSIIGYMLAYLLSSLVLGILSWWTWRKVSKTFTGLQIENTDNK